MRPALLVLLAACYADSPAISPSVTSRVEHKDFPLPDRRELDLLFVVDNSPAMATHLPNVRANLRNFIAVLNTIEGGLPDIHLGVITTDAGTSGRDGSPGGAVPGCTERGDDGRMRTAANVSGEFLTDARLADGTRQRNYTGDLGDVFARIGDAGATGCAYARPFEAVRRALAHPANAGFVRFDAYLAIIFITPNDDCSFERGDFAVDSPAINARECFARPEQLVDVADEAAFLRALKDDPSTIIVSGIMGPTTPHELRLGPAGIEVAPSCTFDGASALPPPRIKALLDAFPNRSTYTSICQSNLSDALALFSPLPQSPRGSPCIEATLLDLDPETPALEADCAVAYRLRDGAELAIPACDAGTLPCWRISEMPMTCSQAPHLALDVQHGPARLPRSTHVVAQCLVE